MQTSLLVELPELDIVIDEHRVRLDPARGRGLRAHVTVLYPFVDSDGLEATDLERLASTAASTEPFEVTFSSVRWFGSEIAWLAPEPADPFRALTDRLVDRYPGYPPYAGAHDDPVPHVTIGHRGDSFELGSAVDEITARLPMSASASALSLMVRQPAEDRWTLWHRFRLGAG